MTAMRPRTRTAITAVTAVAGAAALLGPAATQATALALDPQPPHHITGKVIKGGADGRPHQLFCPAPQNAYSGGYTVSASQGARFAPEPTDVIESRPNANANGWIVTVRKQQIRSGDYGKSEATPADLVIHVVCTEGMPTHGM
ncbi:hypothetical protein AB0I77_03635 [Streptomyces sp. NPDC050619]|uniref:hypothetical protein n=1 Tax=Streptomyces sp. NPDC050619 TaxID=3157214 RepID=UPI00343B5328